jgi:hypothetical protein
MERKKLIFDFFTIARYNNNKEEEEEEEEKE